MQLAVLLGDMCVSGIVFSTALFYLLQREKDAIDTVLDEVTSAHTGLL